MSRPLHVPALASVALLAACAHAPSAATPPQPRAEVVWPEPPAAPRVRLSAILPDDAAPADRAGFWSRLGAVVLGLEEEAPARPLVRPFGVAAGPGGALAVADPDLPGVARAGADLRLAPVRCRGREWKSPMAVAWAGDGALWVADAGAAEVVRVAADGERCTGLGAGELERPTGLAVLGDLVYVADAARHAVVILPAGGGAVRRLGERGEGEGRFNFPTSIAAAPDGTLLVVDALNFRVVRLSADGRWVAAFGRPGEADDGFTRPKGVAVGADGRVYVSDAQRDLVLVFRPDGSFDYALGAGGGEPGHFTHPAGLAVDGARLFVADSFAGRVQVFEILGGQS